MPVTLITETNVELPEATHTFDRNGSRIARKKPARGKVTQTTWMRFSEGNKPSRGPAARNPVTKSARIAAKKRDKMAQKIRRREREIIEIVRSRQAGMEDSVNDNKDIPKGSVHLPSDPKESTLDSNMGGIDGYDTDVDMEDEAHFKARQEHRDTVASELGVKPTILIRGQQCTTSGGSPQ